MNSQFEQYPAKLTVDYSETSNKVTVFFRLILAIPILILLGLILGSGDSDPNTADTIIYFGTPGILFLPAMVMILFRRKYPRWWFDWNLEFVRFTARIGAYLLLLRDEYPSTDEEQSVHISIPYPNVDQDLDQWLPLVKWLLAIPHLVVLAILWVAVILCSVFAWFVILFTGQYPRDLFNFVVGVLRWTLRVEAYAFLLTTDVYPPFSLQE
ncbi:MAG: DUF4389 domain-containing protein [Candidatus Marinimicrobia bacterium]|nr:DUF4389 domain-containing protein [Candidatus Neomarinimicrobiota bacterium]MCF7830276.1 DUF4389 domain-containing protein [Candidatus Neomarinimicrobiota bacterium]MCF7882185.1 DUF4389 domain-containing protein [Candidatus Neomarinimicrobiota bacterium]